MVSELFARAVALLVEGWEIYYLEVVLDVVVVVVVLFLVFDLVDCLLVVKAVDLFCKWDVDH